MHSPNRACASRENVPFGKTAAGDGTCALTGRVESPGQGDRHAKPEHVLPHGRLRQSFACNPVPESLGSTSSGNRPAHHEEDDDSRAGRLQRPAASPARLLPRRSAPVNYINKNSCAPIRYYGSERFRSLYFSFPQSAGGVHEIAQLQAISYNAFMTSAMSALSMMTPSPRERCERMYTREPQIPRSPVKGNLL